MDGSSYAGALIGNMTAKILIGEETHESDHLAQPGLRHLAQDARDP
jgi:hypothetical protein